jgi:hypothetical protein
LSLAPFQPEASHGLILEHESVNESSASHARFR